MEHQTLQNNDHVFLKFGENHWFTNLRQANPREIKYKENKTKPNRVKLLNNKDKTLKAGMLHT